MKKIIEWLKNLLGIDDGNDQDQEEKKGFTLIELLIVIAILGILAGAILIAIDPIDRINAGNDSKVQSDIRQIYDAAILYYTNNNALPTAPGDLVTAGELKTLPTNPSNYASYVYANNGTGDDAYVCGQVKSKAQRKKLTGSVASASIVMISNGKMCWLNQAICPTTYTACP